MKPFLVKSSLRVLLLLCCCGVQAEEKKYDVVLQSSIRGSAEQPKMLFIMPWRSKIDRELTLKKNVEGFFDHLLEPLSKTDLEYRETMHSDFRVELDSPSEN